MQTKAKSQPRQTNSFPESFNDLQPSQALRFTKVKCGNPLKTGNETVNQMSRQFLFEIQFGEYK